MRTGKNDSVARDLYGGAYDGIPKSVFAVVAWYLADACSSVGVGNDGELERLKDELKALRGQILDERQADVALAALCKSNTPRIGVARTNVCWKRQK